MLRDTAGSTVSIFWRLAAPFPAGEGWWVGWPQGLSCLWVEDLEALPLSGLEVPLLLEDELGRLLCVLIHSLFHNLLPHAHPEISGVP